MQPDDELCLCFHVTKRKVMNYLRIERPRRVGQMADCHGAGTGCGWCRPYLEQLFFAAAEASSEASSDTAGTAADASPAAADLSAAADLPEASEYARQRAAYVRSGKGQPPPDATPIGE